MSGKCRGQCFGAHTLSVTKLFPVTYSALTFKEKILTHHIHMPYCWNIWIDKREDCITVLCGHKISLYTGRPSGQRTEDCPPEPVLGDSVMSGRLLISGRLPISRRLLISGHLLISGCLLILTLPLVRKMQRNTGENERNRILGCLVKTRNRVKNPSREKPRT